MALRKLSTEDIVEIAFLSVSDLLAIAFMLVKAYFRYVEYFTFVVTIIALIWGLVSFCLFLFSSKRLLFAALWLPSAIALFWDAAQSAAAMVLWQFHGFAP